MGNNGKLKIGMYWAASCGGCDVSLLEIGPRLLDLIQLADVVFWPCAADFKYHHVAAYDDGYIDVCFFNGGIRSDEQEQIAKLLRKKSKTLVSYGQCAVDGGIPALANLKTKDGIMDASYHNSPSTPNNGGTEPKTVTSSPYGDLVIPELYEQVLRLKDVVQVDYEIPGCPPSADRVWEAILALVNGDIPATNDAVKVACSDKSVCEECKLEKRLVRIKQFKRPHEVEPEPDWCLLEQGIICMGPATRSGCEARCTDAGMPCRGCYGPSGDVEDQGTAMVSAVASLLDVEDEETAQKLIAEIVDPAGTFYRFSMGSSMLKGRK